MLDMTKCDVILKKPLTIREFIDDILADRNTYGDIRLESGRTSDCVLKYNYDTLRDKLPDDIADKQVSSAIAFCGYIFRSYTIIYN